MAFKTLKHTLKSLYSNVKSNSVLLSNDIFEACRKKDFVRVKRLLKYGGINANITDSKGNTPLHYACETSVKNYRELFLSNFPLLVPNVALLELLFKYGANPNVRNLEGKTCTFKLFDNIVTSSNFMSILHGPNNPIPSLIKLLFNNGADFNIQDDNDDTVLHWLLPKVHDKSVLFYSEWVIELLRVGINPNIKNKKHHTCLTICCIGADNDKLTEITRFPSYFVDDIIGPLIYYGASPNIYVSASSNIDVSKEEEKENFISVISKNVYPRRYFSYKNCRQYAIEYKGKMLEAKIEKYVSENILRTDQVIEAEIANAEKYPSVIKAEIAAEAAGAEAEAETDAVINALRLVESEGKLEIEAENKAEQARIVEEQAKYDLVLWENIKENNPKRIGPLKEEIIRREKIETLIKESIDELEEEKIKMKAMLEEINEKLHDATLDYFKYKQINEELEIVKEALKIEKKKLQRTAVATLNELVSSLEEQLSGALKSLEKEAKRKTEKVEEVEETAETKKEKEAVKKIAEAEAAAAEAIALEAKAKAEATSAEAKAVAEEAARAIAKPKPLQLPSVPVPVPGSEAAGSGSEAAAAETATAAENSNPLSLSLPPPPAPAPGKGGKRTNRLYSHHNRKRKTRKRKIKRTRRNKK
jgi:hypothetical protein